MITSVSTGQLYNGQINNFAIHLLTYVFHIIRISHHMYKAAIVYVYNVIVANTKQLVVARR